MRDTKAITGRKEKKKKKQDYDIEIITNKQQNLEGTKKREDI